MTPGTSADKRADRAYLRAVAYADPAGLAARTALYEYQRPRIDLVAKVLSCLGPVGGHKVADVGCGNGRYLPALAAAGAAVTGVDFSEGMLASVPDPKPPLVTADAETLPFVEQSLDDVLLMHMLYHVPRPERAVAEAVRTLRDDGRCLVATNGPRHLAEMNDLWLPLLDEVGLGGDLQALGLVNPRLRSEDAGALLAATFRDVDEVPLRSQVIVDDPDPVVRHGASTAGADGTGSRRTELLARFSNRIADRIRTVGEFRITTEVVLLLARGPRRS